MFRKLSAWVNREPMHLCCECKNIVLADFAEACDQFEFAQCTVFTYYGWEFKGDKFVCPQFYNKIRTEKKSYCSAVRNSKYCSKYVPKD